MAEIIMDDIAAILHTQPIPVEQPIAPPAVADPPAEPRRPRGRPRKDGTPAGSPRLVSTATPEPEKAPPPMPDAGTIAEAMAGLYRFGAFGLMPIKPLTATCIMENAEDIGKAWEAAAEVNPQVRKALLALMTTSVWGSLAMAHLPILIVASKERKPKEVEPRDGDAEVPETPRPPRRLRPT